MDVELRPLSLGEILDRTFQLYRGHFLMFAGISTVAAGIDLVWKLIQTGVVRSLTQHVAVSTLGLTTASFTFVDLLIYVIASALATAATNRAVSAIYLGQPTGIGQAYREIKAHWFRYVWLYVVVVMLAWGLAIVLGIAMFAAAIFAARSAGAGGYLVMGIFGLLMLAVIPLGIWMTLRYSLSNPACVFEDLDIRASLKRSVLLSKGLRGKIFVLLLLAWVISVTMAYAGIIPIVFVGIRAAQSHTTPVIGLGLTFYTLLVTFVTTSITTPLFAIGLTLFYYDARIRKEGFDVEWMMLRATPPDPLFPTTPPAEPTVG